MELLDTAVQVTNLIGFAGGVFAWAILRPLNNSFDGLRKSIDRLVQRFDQLDERQRRMEERLVEIEQRARSAHHRIDDLKANLG